MENLVTLDLEHALLVIEQAIKDEMATVEEWPHPYPDSERRMARRILHALTSGEKVNADG